ncbi:MAG: prepilin-type N-terminal cleavage/methylation domain-containing protein, partial [Xanthomonadales bacterium]|nr:prepilin-type N-terminal cleavage/methylation domain-containing protein [Xanthomonadales bacterium]
MKQAHRQPLRRVARQQSGFSLMEILIVIVLIGMVVAFAANQILGGADKAKWQ